MSMNNPFSGGSAGSGPLPYPFHLDEDQGEKMPHDTYEVYVNEERMGEKVLLTENDSIDDVKHFLKGRGFDPIRSKLEGKRLTIYPSKAQNIQEMKNQLRVYLEIR